jgi:branched-chain amino acid transport system ATP-binding protein
MDRQTKYATILVSYPYTWARVLLAAENIVAGYGRSTVLAGVSVTVADNEVVALLGSNGAGKSTLMKTITGTLRIRQGSIKLDRVRLNGKQSDQIAKAGIALVPEGRGVFSMLTVRENLLLASRVPRTSRREVRDDLDYVCELFPEISKKWKAYGNELSGGQQQMVALGRAIMQRPQVVMLDEPSIGLAPVIVARLPDMIEGVRRRTGAAVLLVEQDAGLALSLATRAYVLRAGQIAHEGAAADLANSQDLVEMYLGVSRRGNTPDVP